MIYKCFVTNILHSLPLEMIPGGSTLLNNSDNFPLHFLPAPPDFPNFCDFFS